MKKIIEGKTYNTDTAILLFENGTNRTADFSDWYEEYYVTKKGNFFVNYWGGATTCYAETFNNGRSRSEGSGIRVIEKLQAIKALNSDSYNLNEDAIEKYMEIEEA